MTVYVCPCCGARYLEDIGCCVAGCASDTLEPDKDDE